MPAALAKQPIKLYQARIWVLWSLGNSCVMAACSMAKKGPTSLPLGLMTPTVAAKVRTIPFELVAKQMPEKNLSAAPIFSIFRLPNRSAVAVMNKLSTESPTSVSVSITPISFGVNPIATRYWTRVNAISPNENRRRDRHSNKIIASL